MMSKQQKKNYVEEMKKVLDKAKNYKKG